MSFIPKDEEHLEKKSNYFGLAKAENGEHKIRILGNPINGWLDWLVEPPAEKGGKDQWTPIRTKATDKRPPLSSARDPVPFWSMVIWNYNLNRILIWDLTQSSIIKKLKELHKSENFGDPKNYDLVVTKTTSHNGKISYDVMPLPPAKVNERIKEFYAKTPIRLEALYENKDPFKDLVDENGELSKSDVEVAAFEEETTSPTDLGVTEEVATLDMVKSLLTKDGLEISKIEDFIEMLSLKQNKTQKQIIEFFVMPETYPAYKKHYQKHLAA